MVGDKKTVQAVDDLAFKIAHLFIVGRRLRKTIW
jgi:hypothetical protein